MEIKLYDIERGEGFPLILLHGNGESSDYFKNQVEEFSAYFCVIAIDTRGHGKSPRGTAPFTLSQFADDLYDYMRERSIQRAHILGFSDGANIALIFALRHPEMVSRLILNGADLDPKGVRPSVQIPIVIGYGVACVAALLDHKAVAKKEMLGLMVTQPHLKAPQLSALTMPVLVIAGTADMIKGSHTREIAAAIPGSECRFIEGDHFIAAKNSQAFNREILAFLRRE